jgi:hypothetical protein
MTFAHAGLGQITSEPDFGWGVFLHGNPPRTPATLYSDENMTHIVGPGFETDNLGNGFFYAQPGLYDLVPQVTPPGANYFATTVLVPVNPLDASSGGSQNFATYTFGFSPSVFYGNVADDAAIGSIGPLDPIGLTGGGTVGITVPVTTYGASTTVVASISASIDGLPDSDDAFSLLVDIVVASFDGNNWVFIQGFTNIEAGSPGGSFDPGAMTVFGSQGSDLSWNGAQILTAGGGSYGIMASLEMSYS